MGDLVRAVRLAVADLRHEWVLTLCIVLAIATAAAPLVILLGLKEGVVSTLRDRLVEDPVNRELIPRLTQPYAQVFFDDLAGRPDVAFVTPSILAGASVISARVALGEDGRRELVNIGLEPTGPGDPLLVENGVAEAPGEGEIVLSAEGAARLGLAVGGASEFLVYRSGRPQPVTLTVSAVLPPRAGDAETAFAPLALVADIERFKLGLAVPERGWPGDAADPSHAYDALLAFTEQPLTASSRVQLRVGVGVSEVREAGPDDVAASYGFTPSPDLRIYHLSTSGKTVGPSTLARARDRLRAVGGLVLPIVEPRTLQIDGAPHLLRFYSADSRQAERLGGPATPWGALRRDAGTFAPVPLARPGAPTDQTALALAVPAMPGGSSGDGETLTVRALSVPLPDGIILGDGEALAPLSFGASLAGAEGSRLAVDRAGALQAGPPDFRSFRLYARSIDDVLTLEADLEALGVPTFTQGRAIERVRELDTALTAIFWILAAVGGIGAAAALGANMYASVQRKTRDYGILRLMGLSRGALFATPVIQAALVTALGAGVALAAYLGFAEVLDALFADRIRLGDRLMRLPASYAFMTFMVALGAGILSALIAAIQVTRIDPAEAIRVE